MDGVQLIQLYLLGQMRARELVRSALESLGLSAIDLAGARRAAENHGLHMPGHDMRIYTELLGEPITAESQSSTDPYRQVVNHYYLPLWPHVRFSVRGNVRGQTGGVGFSAPKGVPDIEAITTESLIPWRIVESQLTALLHTCRVTDEWYPQKDYECHLPEENWGTGNRGILRFDFDLLQEVVCVEPR